MDISDTRLHYQVEQFISHEGRLLDEWRLEEWLSLFHPEGRYWVPMAYDQEDAVNHISLYWEDVPLLKMRIDRLQHDGTTSQFPRSRTCHQMSNVVLGPATAPDFDLCASATYTMAEYRREEMHWFAGFVRYDLVKDESPEVGTVFAETAFRIRQKKVELLNCDSDAGHLRFSVPF